MPLLKLKLFGSTKKKRKKSGSKKSRSQTRHLFTADERDHAAYLRHLLAEENKVADIKLADIKLGKSIKSSFEKWLDSAAGKRSLKKHRKTKKKKKRGRTKKKR